MSLLSGLYVGTSGLQTSSNALNTTAHNLSNVDTTGYTRQQVVQGDKRYNVVGQAYISPQQSGLGVSYEKVRQVRDAFLDRAYRLESGRSSFYSNSYEVATEIETLFGEMEGVEFQESLSDMWVAIQELKKDPSNATNQGLVVSQAASFLERGQAVYNGLSSYQDTINERVKDEVDTINEYGQRIYELNHKIMAIEAGNQEEANDLRDERNQLLDELASKVKIAYEEDPFGAVTVRIEGTDFVTRSYVNELGTIPDEKTGFYEVVWPQDGDAPLYNLQLEISSDKDSDIGGLKSLLLLRGSDRGTYRDIPKEDDYIDPVTGELDKDAYDASVTVYNKTVNKCLIQNTMAEFDKLVNGIISGINNLLNPVKTDETTGDQYTEGINLFLRVNVDEQKTTEAPSDVDDNDDGTWYTTCNMKVNPLLLQNYTMLGSLTTDGGATYTTGFLKPDKSIDQDLADAMAALFADDFSSLNPNSTTVSNFSNYYINLIGEVGTTGNSYKNLSEGLDTTVSAIEASRQQIVGVSDNEELSNMIKFQNAYNAASRYINACNDLLGTLIQSMGI